MWVALEDDNDLNLEILLIQVDEYQLVAKSQSPDYKISTYLFHKVVLIHFCLDFLIRALHIGPDTSFETGKLL